MEPFVEIPRQRWPEVRDSFLGRWPRGVSGFYALDTQIQKPSLGTATGFKVYCPGGDVRSGVVALQAKGNLKEALVLPNSEDMAKLEDALVNTKLINWDEIICIPYTNTDVMKLMRRVAQRLDLKYISEAATIQHFLSRNAEPFNITCPPNTYMAPLKLENIPQVDTAWPHRYPSSPQFFELLIKNDQTYGLFSSEDHSLLAWMVICEVGFLTHLYTDDKHRGKGYAEFVNKYVTNDLLKQGKDVFLYIIESNVASLKLYRKAGFEIIGRGVWTYLSKNRKTNAMNGKL